MGSIVGEKQYVLFVCPGCGQLYHTPLPENLPTNEWRCIVPNCKLNVSIIDIIRINHGSGNISSGFVTVECVSEGNSDILCVQL